MSSSRRGFVRAFSFVAGSLLLFASAALIAGPVVGPNVNMVSGTKWPVGDPFLTKQNEPSLAVSSRNSRHLLAGSNDYRLVPVEIAEALDDPEAWLTIYKSVDGGASWRATPIGGCPINIPECNDSTGLTAALKQLAPNFGADPTVRSGPYGTFFVSFIAGTRGTGSNGVVAVQRFVDKNNDVQRATDVRGLAADGRPMVRPAQDPILPDVLNIVSIGTPGQTTDKPWVGADVPGRPWNAGKTCELLTWTKGNAAVSNAAETVNAFNVYVSFANFTGQGQNTKSQIYVAASNDCGKTFPNNHLVKVSNTAAANQGTSIAIDPLTGAVYVVWRNFDGPQRIMMNKSTDGGFTWLSQPVSVASFIPYDQGATGVSFRTLGFPTVAVSVKNGVSRVHVAWTQRKAAPSSTAPYACSSANPADCDTRIVMTTSLDGGKTWPTAVPVDPNVADPNNVANPLGRGHQVQPALAFAAGKLLVTWLDQRQDHTEGVLQCPGGPTSTCDLSQRVEIRQPKGNLDPSCKLPAGVQSPLHGGDPCYLPSAVWSTYMTDGTPYLVRRHTLDAYAAMADPADVPQFSSSRVSQYTFGNTVQGHLNADGSITPTPGIYDIRQKEVNPPNLPMFSNGRSAFIGDYIDAAGQAIVATGDPAQPYKFNVGGGASGTFVTSGFAPAFHVAFTDNRDVIPPINGDWTTPTCLTTAFTKDANGNIIGVTDTGPSCATGYSGNRNQNVYTAAVVESSVAFANSNSKLLNATTPRGFVVTVRNHSSVGRMYTLSLPAQAAGVIATFDKSTFPSGLPNTPLSVFVQPRSSSARTVWATSTSPSAKVLVNVASTDGSYSTQLVLNPDPNAPLVTNGDGGAATTDTAADNLGNVVLSNAVLTNNVLSNNALTNAVLSNNALTNAVLSNVMLSNAVLSNLDPATAALSNNVLTNNALSNVVLSNAVLSNNALTNAVLSNVVLSNNSLNAALTNLDPANVALSNAVLSNNALTNVALSNNVLSNVMLSNNVLSNAVLSNVALSNAALSNNVLSNNPLAYVALSNAPLGGDTASGGDPDALRGIEPAAAEIVSNPFQPTDLATNSFSFKETTFTVRNRGNIDTTLAIKLMLRDAVCDPTTHVCTPPVDAQGNPLYKLQLVLRKVALVPVAIPPTGPAVSSGRAIRIGIAQVNTEVSNVSDLPLIDPNDPNLGKFLPDDPKAATLSLSAGEYAYATIRAIGLGGNAAPDPADLLRWGVKAVAANANNANGPLLIRTLNFPVLPAFVALTPATPTFQTFGGVAPIAGDPGALTPDDAPAVCTDKDGNPVLNGAGAPSNGLGGLGNFYIDTTAQSLYGPKTGPAWPATGTPLIVNGPSGPQASVPCPPGAIGVGTFTTDASFNSTATISFTPKYWGDFYMRVKVKDASAPSQTDRQVIKVHVNPRPPVVIFPGFPSQLTYKQTLDLRTVVASDSPVTLTFAASLSATNACFVDPDGHTLNLDRSLTFAANNPSICVIAASQVGNETYAPITVQSPAITVLRAVQNINFGALITRTYGDAPVTVSATSSSPTAPTASSNPITFTSTGGICTASGTTVTLANAGDCSVNADQAGNANYLDALRVTQTFTISPKPASVTPAAANKIYGSPDPIFTGTLTGFVAADSVTAAYTRTPGETVLGSPYIISASLSAAAGRPLSNYIITYNTANFTINPKPASVTPAAAGKTYGDPDPPLTGVLSGFLAGDGVTAAYSRTLGETVAGSPYTISATLSPAGVLSNYTVTYNTANFTINPKPASVTPAPASKLYGQADPALTGSLSGFLAADGVTAVYSRTPGETVAGSPYTISATLSPAGVLGNYSITYNTANFTIEGFFAATPMNSPRSGHTSTLLLDGTVLVVGGADNTNAPTATAEVYCSGMSAVCPTADGSFKPTASMGTPRFGHTATLLADGNVLVTGGIIDTSNTPTTSAEVYCTVVAGPVCTASSDIGTFKAASPMSTARADHTATLLFDNRVLIVGGFTDTVGNPPIATSEVYCSAVGGPCLAADGSFQPSGSMGTPRDSHAATLLADHTVLVTGGEIDTSGTPTNTAEIYCAAVSDPGGPCTAADGTFKPAMNPMTSERSVHTASLLQDNRVLVAGGYLDLVNVTASADVYCAVAAGNCAAADLGNFKPVGALVTGRANQTSTVLNDGWVVAAGGVDATNAVLATSELFDPVANTFAAGAPMVNARSGHAATRLQNGRVLVTGGRNASGVLNSAELYNVAP